MEYREFRLDFTPRPYARYRHVIFNIWKCGGCGSYVFDRDRHEDWHGLITQIVQFTNRR